MVNRFEKGDRVRIDIPDKGDLDHEKYHGKCGKVVLSMNDDADSETGDPRDEVIYRVELDSGGRMDFRWRDLRPE